MIQDKVFSIPEKAEPVLFFLTKCAAWGRNGVRHAPFYAYYEAAYAEPKPFSTCGRCKKRVVVCQIGQWNNTLLIPMKSVIDMLRNMQFSW